MLGWKKEDDKGIHQFSFWHFLYIVVICHYYYFSIFFWYIYFGLDDIPMSENVMCDIKNKIAYKLVCFLSLFKRSCSVRHIISYLSV